jgi:V/A-type H+-transporting ATPase subunit E
MDSQLKELLEQIKQEGVQKAQSEGENIIKEAEERARKIVDDAEREANSIREKAREDAEKTTQTGKDALAQASRDLVLSLEGEIKRVFDTVIARETEQALSGESLSDIVAALVSAWVEKNSTDLTVLLPEKQLETVEAVLRDRLAKTMADGVELKPAASVDQGFRVSTEGGSVYYDFSSQGIAEVLGAYVNPKLAQTIRESVSHE